MRQQSAIRITVRDRVIGGSRPLICLPLVAHDRVALSLEARELTALGPDLLEWRVDGFSGVGDVAECLSVLQELRALVGDIPLIFTCRSEWEGGAVKMNPENRLALIDRAMASGHIDLVDIELSNERAFIEAVQIRAKVLGVKCILSYHNFQATPAEALLIGKLEEAEKEGGDIAKIAVMPNDYSDVLTLLAATNKARNGRVAIPMITISMGEAGRISRLAGGLFGSDITFAAGRECSAPGQIPFPELKTGMALLYDAE